MDKDSLCCLNVFQGAVFPVKVNLGNKLSDFSLRGHFTIQWPAVYKNTQLGGLSKGLELIFVGFHLVFEVFNPKLVDDMLQKKFQ